MAEHMHQCMTHLVGPKCRDDVGLGHPWELMTFLRETPNVISEGYT
jgi:hypothetical protein